MNKIFSKRYIMPPLERTLLYIVLNYCLLSKLDEPDMQEIAGEGTSS